MSRTGDAPESAVGLVRGTMDVLPKDFGKLDRLESHLLDAFALAGYNRLRTPILEKSELHERKSGVRIVSKLDKTAQDGVCLRPELTAGIVRAYALAETPPTLPWRVSYAGPVFRREEDGEDRLREFQQVGVELIGAARPSADGEVIWLADWALKQVGISDATIRIGHVGLIREILERSRLPVSVQVALVEILSEAATTEGDSGTTEARAIEALDRHLGHLAQAFRTNQTEIPAPGPSGGGAERLFGSLYPNVVGRRTGAEILDRLRRKWDLGHSLTSAFDEIRAQIHRLADLSGPADTLLHRLETEYATTAPESLAALRGLIGTLEDHGVDLKRVKLDLGFGRSLGFYSQMMFVLLVDTPEGPIEVCGGGRYDGLARELGSDRDDRGVGFAFGLERLNEAIQLRQQAESSNTNKSGYLVVAEDDSLVRSAVGLAGFLRENLIIAVLDGETKPVAAQAKARALGLDAALIVGPEGVTRIDAFTGSRTPTTVDRLIPREGKSS